MHQMKTDKKINVYLCAFVVNLLVQRTKLHCEGISIEAVPKTSEVLETSEVFC